MSSELWQTMVGSVAHKPHIRLVGGLYVCPDARTHCSGTAWTPPAAYQWWLRAALEYQLLQRRPLANN